MSELRLNTVTDKDTEKGVNVDALHYQNTQLVRNLGPWQLGLVFENKTDYATYNDQAIVASYETTLPYTTQGSDPTNGPDAGNVVPFAEVTRSDVVLSFGTLQSAISSDKLQNGEVINVAENKAGNGGGGIWDVVDASTVTANGYNIVQSIGRPDLAFKLRLNKIIGPTDLVSYVDPRQIGAEQGVITDAVSAIRHAVSIADVVNGGGCTFAVRGTVQLPSFKTLESIKLKLLGDQSDYNIAAVINNGISGSGNLSVCCRDVEIIGFNTTQQDLSTVITPANGGVGGIYFEKCSNSTIERCSTTDTWSGIVFKGQHDSTPIENANNICAWNKVERAHSWSSTGNSGVPRGILFSTGGTLSCNYTNECATGYLIDGDSVTATLNRAIDWHLDNGFYILGRALTITDNRAVGYKGNGFSVAYNESSIISNNHAFGCGNMGFRIHCPQRDTIITSNRAEGCGYGFRIENSIDLLPESLTSSGLTATFTTTSPNILETGDFVVVKGADQQEYNGIFKVSVANETTFYYTMLEAPASSTATGTISATYTSQGMTIANNQAVKNSLSGIDLSYIVNSNVVNNHCIENNKSGVTFGTRGGLSLKEYCQNNTIKGNKCYDYSDSPKQVFGVYNYDAVDRGAVVENVGNVFDHKSETGVDYFGAVEYANPRCETDAGSFIPEIVPSGGGTVDYNVQEGRWYRTGNLVTVHIALQLSSVSNLSGIAQIVNMPFAASGGIKQQTGTMSSHAIDHNNGYSNIAPRMLMGNPILNFYVWDSGTNAAPLNASGLSGSSQIYVTITYWIEN